MGYSLRYARARVTWQRAMDQLLQQPFNPCDAPDEEQIPAKIWELLRRNFDFKKTVQQLLELDKIARATERRGPEWKQSCGIIAKPEISHPLAALALQWLVP